MKMVESVVKIVEIVIKIGENIVEMVKKSQKLLRFS